MYLRILFYIYFRSGRRHFFKKVKIVVLYCTYNLFAGKGICVSLHVLLTGKNQFRDLDQSNDWYRGLTELIQHSAHRGISHRRKGAARHTIDIVWLHRSPIPVGRGGGVLYLFIWRLPAFSAPRRRGGWSQHPEVQCVATYTVGGFNTYLSAGYQSWGTAKEFPNATEREKLPKSSI